MVRSLAAIGNDGTGFSQSFAAAPVCAIPGVACRSAISANKTAEYPPQCHKLVPTQRSRILNKHLTEHHATE